MTMQTTTNWTLKGMRKNDKETSWHLPIALAKTLTVKGKIDSELTLTLTLTVITNTLH